MTSAYPPTWPAGRPRSTSRKSAPFNKKVHNGRYMETKSLTIADAVDRLELEIDRLGVRQYVISTKHRASARRPAAIWPASANRSPGGAVFPPRRQAALPAMRY